MNKTRLILGALVALTASSCTMENNFQKRQLKEQKLTITATREGDETQTRTYRDDSDMSIWWIPGDAISLFYGSGTNGGSKFTSVNTTDTTKVTNFTGVITAITGGGEIAVDQTYFWGLYPYQEDASCDGTSVTMTLPKEQTAVPGTFATNTFPSIGRSQGLIMGFYNICSGMKFSVTKEGIKKVTLKSRNGELLTGKAKVSFEGGIPSAEIIDGSDEVILEAPAGEYFEPGKYYFLVMFPTKFTNGFTVTLETFTEEATVEKTGTINAKRSNFGRIANIDANATYSLKSGSFPTPEVVDLGLSVKWASFNLGASSPEEFGYYFAWGEVSPRADVPESEHAWSIYKLCNGEYAHMLKYNSNPSYGDVDGLSVLETEDDAAAVNLLGCWRMPTAEEQEELLNSCTWNWTSRGNVYGYEIVSNVNGKSIFLPAAGYKGDFSDVSEVGETGLYWSSSLTKGSQTYTAQRLRFTDGEIDKIDINRSFALQIRPVWDEMLSPAVNFTDSNFEAYCVENFDTNGDGKISCAEADEVTVIDVTSMGIASLQGIECFRNVNNLRCGENQLTTLDVSNNTALTMLNCRYNQLTSLDVSNNTALEDLDCSYNQLTSLVLNNALTWLSCQFNQLTTLDVSNNTALIYLYCRNNQLTSLDVSNNSALTELICSPMDDSLGNNLLETLYIAPGQVIPKVTENRSINHIPSETEIVVKP